MKKKDGISKLKQALREEKQRADGNYVSYDRIREKYTDLFGRMERVKHEVRLIKESFKRITSNLNV